MEPTGGGNVSNAGGPDNSGPGYRNIDSLPLGKLLQIKSLGGKNPTKTKKLRTRSLLDKGFK